MPTPTTRLRARKIDPGSELNVWGQNVNDQVLDIFDEAIAGVERINLTGNTGTLTLTSSNYVSDLSRNAALVFYGTPAVNVAVSIPAVEKVYVVSNTTAKDVTLSAGGVGVTMAAGDRGVVWCDGTDCGLGSISAATVNGLIANAVLAPGTLPGQAGNTGKFLKTDGAVPLWADVPNPDVGGGADATITTSTTLSASASVVQSVDMASNAQSVRLPPATSLTKGGRKFVFLGVGNRTFGIRDNAGTLLTVVPAGAAAEMHLRDNATAAGSWGVTGRGLEPALTLVDHTAPSPVLAAIEMAARLTDTLSLHFGSNGGSGLYAAAVDSTPGSGAVGTWTAVDTGAITPSHVFRISDTQAIAFWINATAATHKAAVLTVDPVTRAITVGTAASTATTFLGQVTFSGRPVLAQLTATTYVATWSGQAGSTFTINAVAVSVSGSTVTIGTNAIVSSIVSASGTAVVLATYTVTATTALAIFVDDFTGAAGAPYSIRAAVLTVSGTTISVGTSAGINDVVASVVLPVCQLSATKYVVGYYSSVSISYRTVAITVSGTTVTFGSPAFVENGSFDWLFGDLNANRFQPNIARLSDTSALLSYSPGTSAATRHVVVTESGGVLTVGTILYSLFAGTTGGNFPQTAGGFLAFSSTTASTLDNDSAVFNVAISGTSLSVTGTLIDPASAVLTASAGRFGLSGGVFGAYTTNQYSGTSGALGGLRLFRRATNGGPVVLGNLSLNDFRAVTAADGVGLVKVPVEVAANKAAFIGISLTQPSASATASVRLLIVEFAQ